MKTPLNQLIEKLRYRISIKSEGNDSLSNAFETCVKTGMLQAIEDANELLSLEQESIIKAHEAGQSLICIQAADLFEKGIEMDDSEGAERRDAEKYFNETYNTEES